MAELLKKGGSDFRELQKWAREHGFVCTYRKNAHLVFRRPDTHSVYTSQSPSCRFALRKIKQDLLRAIRESEERMQA